MEIVAEYPSSRWIPEEPRVSTLQVMKVHLPAEIKLSCLV